MGEIIKYEAEGLDQLDVMIDEQTVWLNRQQIANLFGRDIKTIGKHIANALKEELEGFSTVAKFATVQMEGGREVERSIEYYNLDMILSIGYRVKSKRGIQFRQWATKVLRDHLLKGYTVKQPVSVEQLNSIKGEIQGLAGEINEILQRQDKVDAFVYEEFGRVYEIISEITEQKRLQDSTPRRKVGFPLPHENNKGDN